MITSVAIHDATDGTMYACQSGDPDRLVNFLGWYIESNSGGDVKVITQDTPPVPEPPLQ